jgi:hypothetical protein
MRYGSGNVMGKKDVDKRDNIHVLDGIQCIAEPLRIANETHTCAVLQEPLL